MRKETLDPKVTPSEAAVAERPAISEDLARRIDCEFERYRAMRDAVRRKSGHLRRSIVAEHCN